MVVFFEVMCSACVKVGLLDGVPPYSQLVRAAASSFRTADINSDGDISTRGDPRRPEPTPLTPTSHGLCVPEFIAWARKHLMTRAILKEFSTVKKGASKHVDKSSVVNLAKKRKAALKKQRKLNAKRLKVLNDSLTAARNVRGADLV